MKITLYVLIAIAWLIFNIVKAVRKASKDQARKAAAQKPQLSPEMRRHTSPQHSALEYTKPQHTKLQYEQPTVPVYQSQEVMVDEAAFDTELEYNTPHAYETYENSSIESGTIETLEEASERSIEEETRIYSIHGDEAASDFDLRRAIIYSEILRRPYG